MFCILGLFHFKIFRYCIKGFFDTPAQVHLRCYPYLQFTIFPGGPLKRKISCKFNVFAFPNNLILLTASINAIFLSLSQTHTDIQLFQLIAGGDQAAFTDLFHRCYGDLYTNALRYVKSEFWAEEIIQEVFVTVWNDRVKLTAIENPLAWLHRLIWNKSVDRIRKKETEVKAQYAWKYLTENAGESLSEDQWEQLFAALHAGVDLLPPQRKMVYQLRYDQGLSYEEIAQKMQLSRNTVRNHLAEAMKTIRAHMLQHVDFYIYCWFCYHFF